MPQHIFPNHLSKSLHLALAALLAIGVAGHAPRAGHAAEQSDIEQRIMEDRESRVFGASSLIIEDDGEWEHLERPTDVDAGNEESRADTDAARIAHAVELLGESPIAAVLAHLPAEARKFNDHVMTLANPFFEGRAPGTAGNRFAADYIEFYFRKYGLEPAFAEEITAHDGTAVLEPRSSFRQPFQSGRELRIVTQEASLILNGAQRELSPGRDFVVFGSSGNGEVTGPIIFAGYSIVDGPDKYASFPDDADFTGRIVMILRFEPMDEHGRSRWADRGWSPAAQLDAKIAAVAERNAAGIILVNPPGADDPRARALIDARSSMMGRVVGRGVRSPVVMLSQSAASDIFSAAFPDGDVTLLSAREAADQGGLAFELPDVEAALNTRIAREPVMTDNIAAILPGRGALADEFIVIGAHYDHIGYGPAGVLNPANVGTLHPGADDNASGTAGMLILAQKLSEAYESLAADEPARSILFIGFSAEELGLIGSRYFVRNLPLGMSTEQIYMMLNLDMIGRLRERTGLTVEGVQTAVGLLDWLRPYFEASDMTIRHGGRVSPNSDHASFYQHDIPVLFFFTGLHTDYHTPTDIGASVNQAGAARVVDLAYQITVGLSQRTEALEFVPRRQVARRPGRQPDAGEGNRPAAPVRRGSSVRFGIAPGNYSDDEPGIEVAEVYEGTSAAEAGVQIGDRIIRWNEHQVTTVESWMPLLMEHRPGDVVEVVVMRDGKEVRLNVTLQGRGGSD